MQYDRCIDKLEAHFPTRFPCLWPWLAIIEGSTSPHTRDYGTNVTPTATWALWIDSLLQWKTSLEWLLSYSRWLAAPTSIINKHQDVGKMILRAGASWFKQYILLHYAHHVVWYHHLWLNRYLQCRQPGMLSPRPGLGLEAQKTISLASVSWLLASASWQLWPRPRPAWSRGLVVFEVLLKCFVTLTLKIWHFLFNV